jgi:formylglycine-generating enzyme required for sulfatase activity
MLPLPFILATMVLSAVPLLLMAGAAGSGHARIQALIRCVRRRRLPAACSCLAACLLATACSPTVNGPATSSGPPGAESAKPEWASASGDDQYGRWADLTIAGAAQRMRWVAPGTFTMGSSPGEREATARDGFTAEVFADEVPHAVTLTRGFWLADSPCTQALWLAVMGANPAHATGDLQRPVDSVSWNDAQAFLAKAGGALHGMRCSLPSEAQREYACRAGSTGAYCGPSLDDLGWYSANSGNQTHAVKGKKPNAWGLYDMHGNVSEWCADWYGEYPTHAVSDPSGPADGISRVLRGGSFSALSSHCRSARRTGEPADSHYASMGLRILIQPGTGLAGAPAAQRTAQAAAADAAAVSAPVAVAAAPTAAPPAQAELPAGAGAKRPAWPSGSGTDRYGKWAELTVGGVTQRLRWVESGIFTMGSSQSEKAAAIAAGEDPDALAPEIVRAVNLSKGFWLADSSCTQALWQAVMDGNPAKFTDDPQQPVEQVSWDDVRSFLGRLNGPAPGLGFTLPTEAQREYACRAATTTPFAGAALDDLGWYRGNSGNRTHAVRQKAPNPWGLYDMHGNVWEWCADWYSDYPSGSVTDPAGPAAGTLRAYRGGSWDSAAAHCRAAFRSGSPPGTRGDSLGFRFMTESAPAQVAP